MRDGRQKGRELAKQETRQALIEAGIDLFKESGVDQPSLDAICKRAGFTRGAFYVHFKDRSDFVIAVLDEALRDFIDSVISEQGAGDVGATIGQYLDAAASLAPQAGPAVGTLAVITQAMHHVPAVRQRFASVLAATLERLAHVAEGDRQAGVIRDDIAPEQIALILVTSAIGIGTLFDVGLDVDLAGLRKAALRLTRPLPDKD